MSDKRARTIYFDKDLDQVLTERMAMTERARSVEACRLIRKGLQVEADQNAAAVRAAQES